MTRARKSRKSEIVAAIDSALLEMQTRCFDLNVQGFPNVQIAKAVGVGRETVARYVRAEADRRAKEYAQDRGSSIARDAARYERMISDSALRIQEMRADIVTARTWPEKAANRALIRLEFLAQLKAQEQSERDRGLHAVTDTSNTTNVNLAIGSALAVFSEFQPDERAGMRREARAWRKADAAGVLLIEAAEDTAKGTITYDANDF